MDATGAGFAEALEEATALGYAEADPTADVEGFDAAAKAAILASLAFHTRVTRRRRAPRGHHRGHRRRRGQRQGDGLHHQAALHRLPGSTRRRESVSVRVHPAMIPRTHPLASVGDAFNAVFVEARGGRAADVLRPGRRRRADRERGRSATSSRWPATGSPGCARPASRPTPTCAIRPMGEVVTRYHVCLDVADRAGVLAAVAGVFAQHDVSHRDRAAGRGRRRPDGRGAASW